MWEQAQQEACLTACPGTSAGACNTTHLECLSHTMQLGQKVMVTVAAQQLCPEGKHKQSGNLGLGVVLSGALGGPAWA